MTLLWVENFYHDQWIIPDSIQCPQIDHRLVFFHLQGPDIAAIVAPTVILGVLAIVLAVLAWLFCVVKKKRQTEGTYRPSAEEQSGVSCVAAPDALKLPKEERLIWNDVLYVCTKSCKDTFARLSPLSRPKKEKYPQVSQQALNGSCMTLWRKAPGCMDFKNSWTFQGFEHFFCTNEELQYFITTNNFSLQMFFFQLP